METIKKLLPILIFGLLLRSVIAATTFHPDIRILDYVTNVILGQHQINPYSYADSLTNNNPRKNISTSETPDDLPLQYFITMPLYILTRPLVNNYIEDQLLLNIDTLFGNPALNFYLLILKLPLILLDLALGVVLALLLPSTLRRKVFFIWMVNPVTLWATAAIGQVDVIPTLFTMLSIYLLSKGKFSLSAFSLGIGAAVKSFPFLLAPFLIFTRQSWKERIKLSVIFVLPWIVTVAPYFSSSAFRRNALFAPQLDKILYSRLPLSGGEAIFLAIFLLIFFYFLYLQKKRNYIDFIHFSTIALLTVLALTHFHIQWFLWVTPFLMLFYVWGINQAQKLSFIGLFISLLMMLFLFEPSLQVGLFTPIFPQLHNATGLTGLLNGDLILFFRSVAASIFAGSTAFFIYTILTHHE